MNGAECCSGCARVLQARTILSWGFPTIVVYCDPCTDLVPTKLWGKQELRS